MPPEHPSEEDRAWLEEELSILLRRAGRERFLRGPILEPTDRFFPDRWAAGTRGVATVARRLFTWAEMPDVGVDVVDRRPIEDGRRIPTWSLSLRDVSPGYVTLEVREEGRPERLPGALTSIVAWAVRTYRGLDREQGDPYRTAELLNDVELEWQLASITAVELGFGLLALDAAQRVDSAGEVNGNWHIYEVSTEEHGALSLAECAYLLAVQLVARGTSEKEQARLASWLPANQSALLRDWCRTLDRTALLERLGITGPIGPPLPFDDPSPLDDTGSDDEDPPRERATGWNRRRPVFRVSTSRGRQYGGAGAATGAASWIGLSMTGLVGIGGLGPIATAAALGAAIGYLVGLQRTHDECSDPSCAQTLPPDIERCPRCAGIVAGRIASRAARLEAEEALGAAWYRERRLRVPPSTKADSRARRAAARRHGER